jgi:mycobactin polyketide synthetase MbtD
MTPLTYRLPNGTIPVLLSTDTPDLLRDEAAALLGYAAAHPEITPEAIAGMLFRTRIARKHRALAMVSDRDDLLGTLQAITDDCAHSSVVRTSTPATARRIGYVFPGQGVQRPGMGRIYYESIAAFRTEVDRCVEAFEAQLGTSPLNYLLDEQFPAENNAGTVQPALFTQMAGLAAMWQSFGITPDITIGHSQGEIAAAYISGTITLEDAVRVIGIRTRAADGFTSDEYAMAIVAADRDTCENLLARCSGWAQLSVVNSPSMIGISGDRATVHGIVNSCTERGVFARIIRVHYPAHTSLINELAASIRTDTRHLLQNLQFLDTEIECLGATLGGPLTTDLPVSEYWFWNLRNTVRFDKAIAAAVARGIDTFVELAEHPTLQLAIHENLSALDPVASGADERAHLVAGTSNRTATDLSDFTHNLALLAVHDLGYSWDVLRTASDGPVPLPLPDFPNTQMDKIRLWLPYNDSQVIGAAVAACDPVVETIPVRLLVEEWVRLSQRSLVGPRAIGIVDHTGTCADLTAALCTAANGVGATVSVITSESDIARADFTTLAILVPASPKLDDCASAAEVAAFFSHRAWWPGLNDTITDCWLITVGGEAVVDDDAPPNLLHAAASAGFRSIGTDYPGGRFRHLDLPAGLETSEHAHAVLAALHTEDEPELALRSGGLYAKRIAQRDVSAVSAVNRDSSPPEHVLITGGTGNLGLEFCDHFAHRGARRITLVSRSGETAAVANRLQRIRSMCANRTQIQVAQCDVSDQAAVSQLAAEHHGAPADVIIHAAVNYSAIELAEVASEKVDQALRAKVVGISRVLATFPRTDGCRVLLCSSARATIGGRGKVVYAAANRMLDAMAHRLRAKGLDCVSVQWGQWTGLDAASTAQLAAVGVVPMSPADALAVGLTPFQENAIVMAFDFDRARPMLEAYGYGPLVSQLSERAAPVNKTPTATEEVDLPPCPELTLMKLLAETIGVDGADKIDTTVSMVAIGLDSLQAIEFRRRVKIEFNHDLAISDLLGGASIADVLAQLDA